MTYYTKHGIIWFDVINDLAINDANALVECFLRLLCWVEIDHFIWQQPTVAVVNARFDYTVPMQFSDEIWYEGRSKTQLTDNKIVIGIQGKAWCSGVQKIKMKMKYPCMLDSIASSTQFSLIEVDQVEYAGTSSLPNCFSADVLCCASGWQVELARYVWERDPGVRHRDLPQTCWLKCSAVIQPNRSEEKWREIKRVSFDDRWR